jgi:N6-L-threonylcarbamoyladenine synthase
MLLARRRLFLSTGPAAMVVANAAFAQPLSSTLSQLSQSNQQQRRIPATSAVAPGLSRSLFTVGRNGGHDLDAARRVSSEANPRWTCSRARRRAGIGLPKNVDTGLPVQVLTAETTPYEDFILPELRGNSAPKDPERFADPRGRTFVVLGIESSCDDTAAAVVRSDGVVLGEHAVSQTELTEEWGGVVPHVARDAHDAAIADVISIALARAGMTAADLDAVGVTMGPGLELCLRVGYRAARVLARDHDKPFVAINHLEAHVLMPRAIPGADVSFPFLTLLVSGGHCQLLLARDVAQYEALGGTLDDALGEAYDKTARLLGLEVGGGGGPALEALARDGDPKSIPFPIPMKNRPDCNFSFAGLKTSVRTAIAKLGGEEVVVANPVLRANVAASFQETAVKHLEMRVKRAIVLCDANETGAKTLVVAGGVAANTVVRSRLEALCESLEWKVSIPPARLCTDNGTMVAWAAIERLSRGIADNHERMDVRARWPLAKMVDMSS